jgi:hypothetical protein
VHLSEHSVIKLTAAAAVVAFAAVACFGGTSQSSQSAAPAQPVSVQAPGQQTVQLTEDELTRQLNDKLVGQPLGSTPMGPATLTRITAQLTNGHLLANGDASVASASVPVSLTASGAAQNGRAVVTVDDLKAAGISLPDSAKNSVQQTLQAQVDQVVDQQQMSVTGISIDDGKLTLVGSHR